MKASILVLAILLAPPCAAQSSNAARLGLTQSQHPPRTQQQTTNIRSAAPNDSHWAVGAVVGTALGLMFGWAIYDAPCDNSRCDRNVTTIFIPALGLGVIGGLIGDAFKKH